MHDQAAMARLPAGQRPPPSAAVTPQASGLSATGLVKQFGRRQVVRGVSLELKRGEVVGLLGPNGAGKTTCFSMIIGLIAPDAGSVVLDDVDITRLPIYRRARLGIGYLPQEPSVFRGLSVEDNLRAVLEAQPLNKDQRRATIDALLSEFGLAALRRTLAVSLSGGERRRLEIARMLASNPQFIFLDEPFAGIDPIALGEIRNLVMHLKDRGLGVLITDHNVRETLDVIDRAYIIYDGRVLMSGTANEIVTHDDVRRLYLGDGFSR
jgi:lipopolysaccharide export system ATP-binding protein